MEDIYNELRPCRITLGWSYSAREVAVKNISKITRNNTTGKHNIGWLKHKIEVNFPSTSQGSQNEFPTFYWKMCFNKLCINISEVLLTICVKIYLVEAYFQKINCVYDEIKLANIWFDITL